MINDHATHCVAPQAMMPLIKRRKIMGKRGSRHTEIAIAPIIQLWMLRILVPLRGDRNFLQPSGFRDDAIAEAVNLGHWVDLSRSDAPAFLKQLPKSAGTDGIEREFDEKAVRYELKQLHLRAENLWATASMPPVLSNNVSRLSSLVGLSATDCRILGFAVAIHSERLLRETADLLGELSSSKLFHVLSVILDLSEAEVQASLGPHGILARSGLVSLDRNRTHELSGKLDLLSDQFADCMVTSDTDLVSLLRGTISAAGPAQLKLSDYGHIKASLDILVPYLRHASASRRPGVNIFLHGAPGTGKSQLVRVLAQTLGVEVFEVASEDSDGDPINGERRLRAFSAAQSLFSQRQALMTFDEVEDVFNDGDRFFGRKSTAQLRKAWVNRMLEESPVPTIWLSNSAEGIDPAFIRRFDMVFELPIPPKSQRERILRENSGDLLDARMISRIAEAECLAPAVISKASSVVRAIRDELGDSRMAPAFERLVSNTLEAQGHQPIIQDDPNRLPEGYDPIFIQADSDLNMIARGLIKARAGRLCLYGPPGTGKTAYGRWLAEQMEIPLQVKRASDLMSRYVGGNEQNIAQAFRRAAQEGALLMIDEVDSFLRDRREAQHGWEANMVNEMLTQMESFPGVFIASTNLMDGLDPAALRRFDLKVKFDFLRPEQAWELLRRHCGRLGLAAPQPEILNRVMRLTQLTPGDFAAVLRQHRFRPIESAAALVAALEQECTVKNEQKSPIGFI